jgi:hypothetical protein
MVGLLRLMVWLATAEPALLMAVTVMDFAPGLLQSKVTLCCGP